MVVPNERFLWGKGCNRGAVNKRQDYLLTKAKILGGRELV